MTNGMFLNGKLKRFWIVLYGDLSPENFKNWRFIIIQDKESKDFIKRLAEEKIHAPWMHNWGEFLYSRMDHVKDEARLEEVERFFSNGLGGWIFRG